MASATPAGDDGQGDASGGDLPRLGLEGSGCYSSSEYSSEDKDFAEPALSMDRGCGWREFGWPTLAPPITGLMASVVFCKCSTVPFLLHFCSLKLGIRVRVYCLHV